MRQIEIHCPHGDAFENVISAVKSAKPVDYWVLFPERQDRRIVNVFLRDGSSQSLVDAVQQCLEAETKWRIVVIPIEATVPPLEGADKDKKRDNEIALREELLTDVARGAALDLNFIAMVVLSTIVAAIGLNSDGVAAVIGAMVIAPLLGPILGFAMGSALGRRSLLATSAKTLAAGVTIALGISLIISFILPINLESRELMSRAEVRLDGVALALAAGGAAALSLTLGRGTVLVGVMVAAALLPPGAAVGLFAGSAEWVFAGRAAMLLALNVACLILAALIVFRLQRVRPRTWIEQKNAALSTRINLIITALVLVAIIALVIVLDLGSVIAPV